MRARQILQLHCLYTLPFSPAAFMVLVDLSFPVVGGRGEERSELLLVSIYYHTINNSSSHT